MKVKEALLRISDRQRARLQFAFEQGSSDQVVLQADTFVGVNIYYHGGLEVIDTAGAWTVGRKL